jgi:hypothetical protein
MRPADAAGFREAGTILQRRRQATIDRARAPRTIRPTHAESRHPTERLLIVLNEEWEHRGFAERDLAPLESDGGRIVT